VVLQDPVTDEAAMEVRSWDTARTDGDRALLVAFIGGPPGDGRCEKSYRGAADEAGDRVTVSVEVVNDGGDGDCPAVGSLRVVRVDLASPLAGRTVVDARTGAPGPLLDGGALLHLADVPTGYAPESEGGSDGGWSTTWASGERGPALVVTHEADRGQPLVPDFVEVSTVEVRGQQAALYGAPAQRSVIWRERGVVITVSNSLRSGQDVSTLLPLEQLVELARGLR
jgi:hypothetical protein